MEIAGTPPLSVILVDTGARGAPRSWNARDLLSAVWNVPRWIVNELATYPLSELVERAAKRIPHRWPKSGLGAPPTAAAEARARAMFDLSAMPPHYRERVIQSVQALEGYRPQRSDNRLFYLRCMIRSLTRPGRPDGGWSMLVPEDRLQIVPIPGEHGSALHPKRRTAVARAIDQCLG
jgi:hypothetical protein